MNSSLRQVGTNFFQLVLVLSAATSTMFAVPVVPSTPASPVEQENGKPILGVYVGNDPTAVLQYEKWLGKPTDGILAFTGDANWQDYDGCVPWAMSLWSQFDRRVLWSVPLIPKGANLADAAKGAYNDHWKKIATELAQWHPHEPIIYVRTGWEFNGDWFPCSAIHQPANFIGAWRQFVSIFRAASPRFRFDWCPAGADKMGMNAEDAYPGDDYVDVIGLDVYDQTIWCKIANPVERWNKIYLNGYHGLTWHRDFAKQHHKPMSYPEWGGGGNESGDNPFFIEQMHKWFIENHVIYASYWNSDAAYKGQLSSGQYPLAEAKYRELFNENSVANPASSSVSP